VIRILLIGSAVLGLACFAGWHATGAEVPLQPLQKLSLLSTGLLPDPASMTNRPTWTSSVSLGFSMTRGNSDTLLAMAKLQTQRRSELNEWLLGANGAYGEDNSEKNRETLHGFGQFNHFFTSRLYDFGRVDGLHDGIKDINYRFTASVGLGYFLVQQTNLSFAVEAGPSLVSERQGEEDQTYAAVRLAERFEYKLNATARIWHTAELIPQVDQTDNFIINAEVGIETAIAKDLALQVYVQDNYVNLPASTYKHNDVRLVSGISYKF
jgi:putative salt-induced outer membrane protein YdiY